MESKDKIDTGKEIENSNKIKSKNKFINLKSNYILKKLTYKSYYNPVVL